MLKKIVKMSVTPKPKQTLDPPSLPISQSVPGTLSFFTNYFNLFIIVNNTLCVFPFLSMMLSGKWNIIRYRNSINFDTKLFILLLLTTSNLLASQWLYQIEAHLKKFFRCHSLFQRTLKNFLGTIRMLWFLLIFSCKAGFL